MKNGYDQANTFNIKDSKNYTNNFEKDGGIYQMMDKETFLDFVQKNVHRKGIDSFLEWLGSTDFFVAPASTSHHGAYVGGLMEHSWNVYMLLEKSPYLDKFDEESIEIVALFHDICKIGLYKDVIKNGNGELELKWEHAKNNLPMGHGEKSIYLLQKFIQLTDDEALAISWHMGGFDRRVMGGSNDMSDAFFLSPLALELHLADMRETYLKI